MIEQGSGPDAAAIIALIESEFQGVQAPVSAEHVAKLYGVMAAQSEAILAVYALAVKANPSVVLTDERVEAERTMTAQAQALSNALIQLAKTYGNTESLP